jgi:hypothetical protein
VFRESRDTSVLENHPKVGAELAYVTVRRQRSRDRTCFDPEPRDHVVGLPRRAIDAQGGVRADLVGGDDNLERCLLGMFRASDKSSAGNEQEKATSHSSPIGGNHLAIKAPDRSPIRETGSVTSRSDRPLPANQRPVDETPIHTADLPPLPTATYNIPATAWIEAPAELLEAGSDIGQTDIMFKRRIGSWLLWRAGPASKANSRYVAIHADDLGNVHTFRLFPDRSGSGFGPSGTEHTRFRTWKEELNETP